MDKINPKHYQDSGPMEVWEMMVAIWGPEKYKAHCEMCAFKYRMRAGKKSDDWETDLRKAEWYENQAKKHAGQINENR